MGKTILFSPVGGTDPIAEKNMQDGSLLHICRVYKPDTVILYMSAEILEKHRKDNRYIECLERLAAKQERKVTYQIIEKPDLQYVQKYDYFYTEYRDILFDITDNMTAEDTLLLNVSSGTPAMKSSLIVLNTIGEFPAKMIQVYTPEEKMNEHEHSRNYALDELWELNEDNKPGFINRCTEVSCPTLSDLMKYEIIKKHVGVYDYRAARGVAETLLASTKKEICDYLEMAEKRLLLVNNPIKGFRGAGMRFDYPVRQKEYAPFFEYALMVDIKYRRGEYGDFIRCITPLLVNLFDQIIQKQFGLKVKDFCEYKRGGLCWSRRKLQNTPLENVLQKRFSYDFKYGYLSSEALLSIIEEMSENIDLSELAEALRSIEISIRNLAAHEVIAITEKKIKEETGYAADEIVQFIKKGFTYTFVNATAEQWRSYDDMNSILLDFMTEASVRNTRLSADEQ
ncbi:MAG: CRISPR-associated protein Csm6 [Lachnospiraceae bacterium]|nr:CRISPR-associated protein Csm6 [Lachnospiraceae bacterium]